MHVTTDIDSLVIPQVNVNDGGMLLTALHSYYNGLFNPQSRTVGIDFYDSLRDGLLSAESFTMQGNDATFTVGIPAETHLCQAVSPDNDGADNLSVSSQPRYSGRRAMTAGQSSYSIDLYPVDAQVALVANIDSTIDSLQVFADSTSAQYTFRDSTYSTSAAPEVALTLQPSASTSAYSTYTATLFPSVGQSGSWQITILATTASGSVTRTVLNIREPLRPGDIRIFTVNIDGDGAARTNNSNVGATVTLNWKPGGEYNHDL